MKMTFDVTRVLDGAGVATYFAKKESDLDSNGVPIFGSPNGMGETELEAIADLANKLVIIEENKAMKNK